MSPSAYRRGVLRLVFCGRCQNRWLVVERPCKHLRGAACILVINRSHEQRWLAMTASELNLAPRYEWPESRDRRPH
jgi:hypothetical protein